jgi:hypothetical protein
MRYPIALLEAEAEVELSFGVALLGRQPLVTCRLRPVLRHSVAERVERAEID